MMIRAALLDIDGTLLDSNDAHANAWVGAFAAYGRRVDFSRVRPLIGKGGDKLLFEIAGIDAESKEGKALAERRLEIFKRDYLPHLKPTRGARGLLERLQEQGLTLAIATSAQSSELGDLLRVAQVDDLIHTATSSDDAEESKPDPDIIHAALKKARCDAAEAIMIGDTPYDVEAAGKAGVRAIALRCGGWWSDEALGKAAAIYNDPEDLRQNLSLIF
jgi:HAD superfamily hydrolase (TIGR01509 family)